jgi:hypothetical protein
MSITGLTTKHLFNLLECYPNMGFCVFKLEFIVHSWLIILFKLLVITIGGVLILHLLDYIYNNG